MTESSTKPGISRYRVLFQYFNPTEPGPHFEFTTVLSASPEAAATAILSARADDRNLSVVQVVDANDFATGFDFAEIKAQRTLEQITAESRAVAVARSSDQDGVHDHG